MNNQKSGSRLVYIVLALAVIVGASWFVFKGKKDKTVLTIGILQTASHPALDAARQGFMETMQKLVGTDKVAFVVHNAQGSVATAQTIAQQLHANSQIKGIYAIATPALQAAASVEKEKPIFIAAVTDPAPLGVMHATTNVTGASDMINIEQEVQMLHQLVPTAKIIALPYSSAEPNSLAQINAMKAELAKLGLEPLEIGITHESDLPSALSMAVRKADALLVPTDNIIASSMELVASQALENKKPLIASHNQAVNQGALASRGVDYYENGKQAAESAYKVLVEGKKPYEVPIAHQTNSKIHVNKKTLEALGLTIPQTMQSEVVFE